MGLPSFNFFLSTRYRIRILFQKQISTGLFQDSDGFFKGSKIHINPYTPKISLIILLTALHTLYFFYKIIWFSQLTIKRFESRRFERLVEFSRFPELSRSTGFFPVLSNSGKYQNKILGLPRFSRTCTNSVDSTTTGGF